MTRVTSIAGVSEQPPRDGDDARLRRREDPAHPEVHPVQQDGKGPGVRAHHRDLGVIHDLWQQAVAF